MSENKINIGIVVGEFHYDITKNMLNKAIEHAEFLGCNVLEVFKELNNLMLKRQDIPYVVV